MLYVERSLGGDGHYQTVQNHHLIYLLWGWNPSLSTLTTDELEVNAADSVGYISLGAKNTQVLPLNVTVLGTSRQKTNYKVVTSIIGTNLT